MQPITALMAWAAVSAAPAEAGPSRPPEPPRLIVLAVVDQMGDELLDRHGRHLTGGFRRLLDGGRRFTEAEVAHAPTNSLPGHLTAASGAHPRRHGIVDNSWVEWQAGEPKRVTGFSDPGCPIVTGGGIADPAASGIGPGRFEAPTIVEWTLAAHPEARFASVGTGGGVSALHAGRTKGPVLWFDAGAGGYVTSACYAPALPAWASSFNGRLARDHMGADWTLAAPPAMLAGLRPDAAPFEHGGSDFAFPHRRPAGADSLPRWFHDSPFADRATLHLAMAAIENESLGADAVTDILTLGLSSLDHVGHAYGPWSVEQADALFRLDHELGAFFAWLDDRVGAGRWAVALTADHGAPPAPEDAARFGIEGARRIGEAEVFAAIDKMVAAAEGASTVEERTGRAEQVAESVDFVARALTPDEIARATPARDRLAALYANAFRPGRVSRHPLYENDAGRGPAEFGIVVVPHPHAVVDWATSIHGSPYAYDREVEMIFMGPGVAPGESTAPAYSVDVAPTLAAMAGIAPVAEIDGKVLDLRAGKQ